MTKTCSKCHSTQDIEQFPKHVRYAAGRTTWCRACLASRARQWAANNQERARELGRISNRRNPDLRRNSKFKARYGITLTQYDAMIAKQDNRCLICGRTGEEAQRGRLVVDHCHTTGKIRGLLCGLCNVGLGSLGDSPALLIKAAQYLTSSIELCGSESNTAQAEDAGKTGKGK